MEKLVYQSKDKTVTMEIVGCTLNIHQEYGSDRARKDLVAQQGIADVWDMLRDHMATLDVGPDSEPGLWRRKGEAIASLTHQFNAQSATEEEL